MSAPDIILWEADKEVGQLLPTLTSFNADAWLYDTRVRFDVAGFLKTSIRLHDLNRRSEQIGTITINGYDKAELTLVAGGVHTWNTHTATMSRWQMRQENGTDTADKEGVSGQRTQQLAVNEGIIQVDLNEPEAVLVVLSGLFIHNYFSAMSGVAAAGIAVG